MADAMLKYLQNLQGLVNDLAGRMTSFLDDADAATVLAIRQSLENFDRSNIKAAAKQLQALEARLVPIRAKAFSAAKTILLADAVEVIDISAGVAANEIGGTLDEAWKKSKDNDLAIRRKMFQSKLPKKKIDEILNYRPFASGPAGSGTIADWFAQWERNDLHRIVGAVKKASVEGLELGSLVRSLTGYRDRLGVQHPGVFDVSRESARTVARTLINGVSNAGKMELYQQNADVIDGVKWLSTLDTRTCIVCASLDGKIWPPDQLDMVKRAPAHPNCRCAMVPYIDLGPEFDVNRAAEVKNFDKDAEEAYNEARDAKIAAGKNPGKEWDELAFDTRRNKRYEAIREYESENGAGTAYRQVKSTEKYEEYFSTLDAKDQREWLGATRYRAYRSGNLPFSELIYTDGGYVRSVADLRKIGLIIPNTETWDFIDRFDSADYPDRDAKTWNDPLASKFIDEVRKNNTSDAELLMDWTDDSSPFNDSIRSGTVTARADRLSKIIETYEVPENVHMYRVTRQDMFSEAAKSGVKFETGRVVRLNGFTAMSASEQAKTDVLKNVSQRGLNLDVEMEIFVPKGAKAIPLSQASEVSQQTGNPRYDFQQEWLLQHNTEAYVIENRTVGSKVFLKLLLLR